MRCESPLIKVSASDRELAAEVCNIAAKADVGFGELGLTIAGRIVVQVSDELDVPPGHWLALANLDQGFIEVPSVKRLEAGGTAPFPMLSTPVLFESLIVHELAHAYIDHTAGERFVSRLAHEYLAFALQLDQLLEHERGLILREADISEPIELGDFNEAVLSFSPLRYAAMAWLHFTRRNDRAEFTRSIIEGEVIFQSLRE